MEWKALDSMEKLDNINDFSWDMSVYSHLIISTAGKCVTAMEIVKWQYIHVIERKLVYFA